MTNLAIAQMRRALTELIMSDAGVSFDEADAMLFAEVNNVMRNLKVDMDDAVFLMYRQASKTTFRALTAHAPIRNIQGQPAVRLPRQDGAKSYMYGGNALHQVETTRERKKRTGEEHPPHGHVVGRNGEMVFHRNIDGSYLYNAEEHKGERKK